MTLLLTEIHNPRDPRDASIIFAADRRISEDGRFAGTAVKIMEVPRLNAGIGYFGLAHVAKGRGRTMGEWVRAFLRQDTSSSLGALAQSLASRLNADVPRPA